MSTSRHWWKVYAVFGMMLFVILESEGKLLKKRIVEVNKCPFSLLYIGTSLSDPVIKNQRTSNNIWDFVNSIFNIFARKDTSVDKLNILSAPTSEVNDCQNVPPSELKCNSSHPYRNYDGTCNNLRHPTWGMVDECQMRLQPAFYEGADGFRNSVTGDPLPEPRRLSRHVLPDVDHEDPSLSHMFVFFGQFVAHDIMKTPTPTRNLDDCCPYDERNRARIECVPIFVKPDDPFYSRFNRSCLNFERANECILCNETGKTQKFNNVTVALDLSHVYGTSEEHADLLRSKDGTGRFRVEIDNTTAELLPRNIGIFSNFCPVGEPPSVCFFAGDDRVDQHSTLTSLHTLFMREHNRLATRLKELNPHWQEETLFQEARKIFGGQWQYMVFNEYLPLALGPRHMSHFGLWVGKDESRTRYNPSTRIGTWIEVSTAGFRLHSMAAKETGFGDLRFYETYSNPFLIREGYAESLLKGACRVPSQKFGRFFVEDVDGFFLKQAADPFGKDLGSIDIKRGRDNGLPPYVLMVEYLTGGQTKVTSFNDLKVLMIQKHIELLKTYYNSVYDVDLFVGLQLEKRPSNSNVGFNSATLSALQFHYLKYGDRFYFEHTGEEATSFTKAQLESLRQISISRLLCDNANVTSIQKQALLLPGPLNPVVNCDRIAELDLTPWKTDS